MFLIDTSVWIDYFHDGKTADFVDNLIDNNDICINDIVLAELIPFVMHRGEMELEYLLKSVPMLKMDIDWHELILMQYENLEHGINKVGISDLIIAQNAMQNNIVLFSLDKHFLLMSEILPLQLLKNE